MRNICDRNNRNAIAERTGFESKKRGQLAGTSRWVPYRRSVIDVLIFFWDPLEPLPHDQGIKAQLRFAVVVGSSLRSIVQPGTSRQLNQVGDGRDMKPAPIILLKVDETKDSAEVVRSNKKKE